MGGLRSTHVRLEGEGAGFLLNGRIFKILYFIKADGFQI